MRIQDRGSKKLFRLAAAAVGMATMALASNATSVATASTTQRSINLSKAASADVELQIELIVGEVEVVGWDRAEVQVTGTADADVASVDLEGGSSKMELTVELPAWDNEDGSNQRRRRGNRDHSCECDVSLQVRVPMGARVQVEAVTAPIRISNVSGELDLETVTGSVEVSGPARHMTISTVTGRIYVGVPEITHADLEAVNGEVTVEAALARNANVSIETVNGPVELVIPADTSAEFDVETFSGTIDNAFGSNGERTSRWVPGLELHFRLGDGSADVSIETLNGRVILRQR